MGSLGGEWGGRDGLVKRVGELWVELGAWADGGSDGRCGRWWVEHGLGLVGGRL